MHEAHRPQVDLGRTDMEQVIVNGLLSDGSLLWLGENQEGGIAATTPPYGT